MVLHFRGLRSGFLKVWRSIARTKSKTFVSWIHERQLKILTWLKWREPSSAASYFRSEDLTSATSPPGEAGNFSAKESNKREDSSTAKALFTVTCIWLLGQATKSATEAIWSQSHPFACSTGWSGGQHLWLEKVYVLSSWTMTRCRIRIYCLYCILYSNNHRLSLQQKRRET